MHYDYRAERRARGLTQPQLARLADVSVSSIANVERGAPGPSEKLRRTLREVLERYDAAATLPGDSEGEVSLADEVRDLRARVDELEAAVRFLMRPIR